MRKPPARSGYFTIAGGLRDRFDQRGPWAAAELARIDPGELANRRARERTANRPGCSAAELDHLRWQRGQLSRYQARPRHRSRCTAY